MSLNGSKLLFVQAGFGPGGAEKVIAMLSNHFVERGCEVHATAFSMPENGPYFSMNEKVRTSALSGRRGQFNRITHVRSVIRELRPDVVISFLTKVNVITLIATLDSKLPVIISERNNPRLQDAHPGWARLQSVLGRRSKAVVALTQKGLADLPGPLRRRGRVIPNPIEPFTRAQVSNSEKVRHLVSVGRLVPQKGFHLLLETMARIHAACPWTTLTIYGEGPERPALEQLRKSLGLEGCVHLPGNTARVGDWANDADIVVGSSLYEGFHNVVAEAVVSGIPVVSFDCDYGPSEFIRHGRNGYLVPTGDVTGLAEAAIRLINDPTARAGMANESDELRALLSPERVYSAWENVVADAVARNGRMI